MHDHLRDLGRDLAGEFSSHRLWRPEHLKPLVCFFLLEISDMNIPKSFATFFSYNLFDILLRIAERFDLHLCIQESKQFKNILTETTGRCLLSMFDWSFGAQITCFLGNMDDSAEAPIALIWLQLDLSWSVHTSIPSWVLLQNLECLRIVDGRLKRLWQNDTGIFYYLSWNVRTS